ncbi:MnhB domain-containing protein [Rhodoligotrophos defluvii]|uniref:MnhB domain-containing protein n=1 Tax=Rhodoligotrophos defluvii TaxID=2561934 RepID=UPI0010C9A49C|nr:MnhB domain-containing protein [Rhodoligotrophos defluvii]
MRTVILRTIVPILTGLMALFSVFVLLRGHNEAGGGFIGGLIAASALALYGIACGVQSARQALVVHPIAIAGAGVFLAGGAGLLSFPLNLPYLTGLWWPVYLSAITTVYLSTPLLFDIGVYLVVVGAISSIAFALEEGDFD